MNPVRSKIQLQNASKTAPPVSICRILATLIFTALVLKVLHHIPPSYSKLFQFAVQKLNISVIVSAHFLKNIKSTGIKQQNSGSMR